MPTQVTDPAILAQLRGSAAPASAPPQGVQQVTDPAILAQLQGSSPMAQAAPTAMTVSNTAVPPPGLVPGSKDYAQWAIQQVKAGKTLPQVSKPLPAVQGTSANMTGPLDQISAGFTSAVNALPIVGPSALSGLEGFKAGLYGVPKSQITAEDTSRANQNQFASGVGDVAGTLLPFIAGGEIPGVAKVLGMESSVPLIPRMLASGVSNSVISAADANARGQDPLTAGIVGGAAGVVAPGVSQILSGIGSRAADAATTRAQAAATNAAIKGVDASSASLKAAGSDLFDAAFPNGSIPAVSPQAYARLWNNIAEATARYRPNAANDPQAVGLLQHFAGLGQDVNTPGTIVDLKDLHMARQLAQQIGQLPGRQGAIGSIVTNQLDDFMKGLQPADMLGAENPTQKVSDLFQGISTWNRAIKVGTIEDAIQSGTNAKSGPENGLKNAFAAITRTPDFTTRYTPAEQQAIQQVAKGTALQNFASVFGKLGVNFSSGPSHALSGGAGTAGVTAALLPFMGPGALLAGPAITTGAGYMGRGVAEGIANKSAQRAVNVLATPNIPNVAQVPNYTGLPASVVALLTRGAPLLTNAGQQSSGLAGVPAQ